MKAQEGTGRLKVFQLHEKRCEIVQLEMMISEFERMVAALETQISDEEHKSGNRDVNHFTYSSLARALRKRRDNLANSIRDLQLQKTNSEIALYELNVELQRVQDLKKQEKRKTETGNSCGIGQTRAAAG